MKDRGQVMLEYAVLLGVLVAVFLAMTVYLKRALQGSMREQANQISDNGFYSPGATKGYGVTETSVYEKSSTVDDVTSSEAKYTVDTFLTEELLPLSSEPQRMK